MESFCNRRSRCGDEMSHEKERCHVSHASHLVAYTTAWSCPVAIVKKKRPADAMLIKDTETPSPPSRGEKLHEQSDDHGLFAFMKPGPRMPRKNAHTVG